ncbi:MAG: hypothetical protein J0L88_07990 [Xanthomonadales bacterium]|nr:hypothetical protein [Xanthomonadales bacterium]
MNSILRLLLSTAVIAAPAAARAQVIANPGFEGDSLAGWTIGGTNRVGPLQASHLSGGLPGGVPGGTWFVGLSTTPTSTTGGATALIDNNTTTEYDIATLSITVTIPFWPAALEFDWTFPSSEQDQDNQFDDLFDVMVYQGTPPTDPTVNNRLFARSAPRNVAQDFSNFTNAHFLGTTVVNHTINRAGSALDGTSLRYGVAAFRRECIGIDLPEFPGPPYTRTIRFRVADQGDRNFDSALLLDRVQVVPRCDAAQQMTISQRTNTSGSDVRLKDGGLQYRPVQARKHAIDPAGRVQAVASNANLDGNNPSLVEQVYLQLDQGGWVRASGLTLNDGGEVQALALSGVVGTTPGRYLAIAARTTATGRVQVYRWDRQAATLTTITSTTGCDNTNPAINFSGTVVAFESTCSALTGAGTTRKIVLWTGGATNVVTAFQGSATNCIGRSPALNTNSGHDGSYVAFESNCNHATNNADGNFEIFRYRNANPATNRFAQITNTTGTAVINTLPQMDRADNTTAGNVYFLSNLADTARGLHVFQYACANANCSSGTRTQWTDGPATQWYTGFRKLIPSTATDNTVILDFVFERQNLGTGFTEVGHRIGSTGQETTITLDQPILDLGAGRDGTVPVIGFVYARDLVGGQNTDLNPEVFNARVQ